MEALHRHISPTPDPSDAGVLDPIRHPLRRVKLVNRRIEPFHHGLLGNRLHLTFEVSGLSGHLYDGLVDVVDRLEVSNPTKLTWIYRTAKKNDRIDARKQAVLLSMNEVPRVHMPCKQVREWRRTIQHRRNVVTTMTWMKNRIRSLSASPSVPSCGVLCFLLGVAVLGTIRDVLILEDICVVLREASPVA